MEQTFQLHGQLLQQDHKLQFELPLWADILATAHRKNIPKGTYLLRETEQCSSFMWLLEGTVRIYKNSETGREITLYRIKPGELCVLSLQCLLGGKGFPAVAVAETEVVSFVLNKNEFDNALDESKPFRNFLLKELSKRLSETVQLVSNVTFQRLELRLSCLLGRLFTESNGREIQITHSEIAHELGTTREMVSRTLKSLEARECISLSRGSIYLISDDTLKWFTNR